MSQPPPGPGRPDGEQTTRLPPVPPAGAPPGPPPGYVPPAPAQRPAPPATPRGYAPQPGHHGRLPQAGQPGQPGPPNHPGHPDRNAKPKRKLGITPPTPGTHQGWRTLLFGTAVVLALVALVLFLLALFDHTTVTESVTGSAKTTSTRYAPTFAMAGAVGAAALALVLCAAFFERITKIHLGGMEFDLDTVKAAVQASEAAGGDETTRSTNVKRALARLAVAEPAERARLIAQPAQLAAEIAQPPAG